MDQINLNLEKKIARAIEIKLQFTPNGRRDKHGNYIVTAKEIENFHKSCDEAAKSVIGTIYGEGFQILPVEVIQESK